jgi:acetyl-CoA carboxylase alpha subunit
MDDAQPRQPSEEQHRVESAIQQLYEEFHQFVHECQREIAVWHHYAMIARHVERPCCLRICIGQNCPKTLRLLNGCDDWG